MKIQISTADPLSHQKPLLAIPVGRSDRLPRELATYDSATGGQLAGSLQDSGGKSGTSHLAYTAGGGRVLLVGTGSKGPEDAATMRRAAGRAGAQAQKLKCERLAFLLPARGKVEELAQAAAEGLTLGSYVFNRYQTIDPRPDTLKQATLLCTPAQRAAAAKGCERGAITGWAQAAVRDMVNTPPADWTPATFARVSLESGRKYGFAVEVKEPAQLKKEKFGGLLAVGAGSVNTPRLIRMDYRRGKGQPVVLVGKGITFDTGGISLKPGADMDQMKGDMAGAGVVLATLVAISRLGLKLNVTGVICSAENMPSGTAYRPGDVVTAYGGKTIEVLNTDAEGRIVLADGLAYAQELNPRLVIDLATLTGAIIIALGHHTAGVMGNDAALQQALLKSAHRTGEKLWVMPLDDEHTELVKSDIADVKNSAGRPAASCSAAAFLKTFVGKHPWAHLDIAGVDLEFKGTDYVPRGPSGFGVRLLVDFLSQLKNG
jgi:leucyl aminopeptidase